MPCMEKSTYLAYVPSEIHERKYEHFQVRKEAQLISVGAHLSGLQGRRATLLDISIGGAVLDVAFIHGLPDHYYLKIEGFPNRIGCAEAFRNSNRIGVKFIAPIDENFMHKIIRAEYFNGRRN
jgi:hypothetical protein